MVRIGDSIMGVLRAGSNVLGIGGGAAETIAQVVMAVGVLVLAVVVNHVVKRILRPRIEGWVDQTTMEWDNVLKDKRVILRLSHLAPALVVYFAAAWFPVAESWVVRVALAYMALVGLLVIQGFLDAIKKVYEGCGDDETGPDKPIEGYIQAAKILLFVVGTVLIPAILIGQSPWKLLTGLGAMTAIVLLVFRDSILGLVASVQIQSYKIVQQGDWIEMPKFGADGDVEEISLHTVKVRNWDKTITTIPTTAFVSDSFKNWQAMRAVGGRRIKRCVHIDMSSVKFCTEEMLERFRTYAFLADYVDNKLEEIDADNQEHGYDTSVSANGRRLTNIGTFRAYLLGYLGHHPELHDEGVMTLLVRHRDPSEHGLPIEIYVFTKSVVWAEYERVQADVFDHVLAVIPQFDLRVFQAPSGTDLADGFRALTAHRQSHVPAKS